MAVIIILLLLVASAALYMAANAKALARKARGASARNDAGQLARAKETPD